MGPKKYTQDLAGLEDKEPKSRQKDARKYKQDLVGSGGKEIQTDLKDLQKSAEAFSKKLDTWVKGNTAVLKSMATQGLIGAHRAAERIEKAVEEVNKANKNLKLEVTNALNLGNKTAANDQVVEEKQQYSSPKPGGSK